jgi:hypothetical protein
MDDAAWLEGVAAIEVNQSGDVVVYDAASARILVLSPDLAPVGQFGRPGRGPGELQPLPYFRYPPPPTKVLSVSRDGHLGVYDGVTVHRFAPDGGFEGYAPGFVRNSVPTFGMIGIALADDGLLVGVDTRTRQHRELQTRVVSAASVRVLFALPLAPVPPTTESPIQARPQWATRGDFVYAGDGEKDLLLRYQLSTGRLDSVSLPDPGLRGQESRPELPRLPTGEPRPVGAPTAVWRWENLVVDPDGFIWISPRDRDLQRAVKVTAIVDPQSKRVWMVGLPAYPRTFGPPGVFYSADAPPPEWLHVIRKYRLVRP